MTPFAAIVQFFNEANTATAAQASEHFDAPMSERLSGLYFSGHLDRVGTRGNYVYSLAAVRTPRARGADIVIPPPAFSAPPAKPDVQPQSVDDFVASGGKIEVLAGLGEISAPRVNPVGWK